MALHEYDVVALTEEIQGIHKETHQPILLQPGQVGTILMSFEDRAYLVDFADTQGNTYAMETIPSEQLIPLLYEPRSVNGQMKTTVSSFSCLNLNGSCSPLLMVRRMQRQFKTLRTFWNFWLNLPWRTVKSCLRRNNSSRSLSVRILR